MLLKVKCSLGQVCVCHGQTNKLIGLWKVLAYFPQIQMSKFVFDSIFAAKIYPIFTILFTLKYIRDQKLNNRFLLSLSKKNYSGNKNKEIFRRCFVSCPWLWAGMFSFFVHILQAIIFKIQVKSWFSILTPCSLYCSWYSSPPPEVKKDQIWFRNYLSQSCECFKTFDYGTLFQSLVGLSFWH